MKKTIAIIGGGPSALILAATLNEELYDVAIYDRNYALGRKFLIAGDGGFNVTHSEPLEQLIGRYIPKDFLERSLRLFTNNHLRNWLAGIGIETFVGSSKRVFPIKGIKPIMVLNAILKLLKEKSVAFKTVHNWQGWNSNSELIFKSNEKTIAVKADIVIFALGGASWTKTGSDGSWTSYFNLKHIETIPFEASNCAYQTVWKNDFIAIAEGKPLKNIKIYCGEFQKKGEVVITNFGLEGGAIYALSYAIRKALNEHKVATIFIDLKPDIESIELKNKLKNKEHLSISEALKKEIKLSEIQIGLLKSILSKEAFVSIDQLVHSIKRLPIQITGIGPMNDAISTVGGVSLDEIDENFQLRKLPRHYVLGEMLDWDAPTGGYLLQGCFSMGHYLGNYLNSLTTQAHFS